MIGDRDESPDFALARDAFLRARDADTDDRDALLAEWDRTEPALATVVRRMLARLDEERSATGEEAAAATANGIPLPSVPELLQRLEACAAPDCPVDPAHPEVGNRYRIVGRLGGGSAGEVYRAEQVAPVHRLVAIKVFRAEPAVESEGDRSRRLAYRRFEREARVLALLDHQGIAKVLDVGVTSDGRRYLVMELVEGKPIDRACEAIGAGFQARVELLLQACAAVEHAHTRGVIHRDLKPTNVLVAVANAPTVKVIDFGIARLMDAERPGGTRLTLEGQVVGTLVYMSPEQLAGQAGDVRCDVYALGAILFELLAGTRLSLGRRAPGGSGDLAIDLSAPTSPIPRRRRDLEAVIDRATAVDPESRYSAVSELSSDLRAFLDDRPIRARPASPLRRALYASRRAPFTAALVVVALVATVAAVAGITASRFQLAAERDRERHEVIRLIDDVLAGLYPLVGATEPRRQLTELLLQRVDALLAIDGDDPDLRLARARLLTELGNLATERGDIPAATRLRSESLGWLSSIARDRPDDPMVVRLHADAIVRRADLTYHDGDEGSARTAYREAFGILREAHDRWPDDEGIHDDLTWAYDRIYTEDELFADPGRVLALIEARRALAADLLVRTPNRSLSLYTMLESERCLAHALGVLGRNAESLEHFRTAIAIGRRLTELEPGRLHYRIQLGAALVEGSKIAPRLGDDAMAAAMAAEADRHTAQLLADEPDRLEVLLQRLSERANRSHRLSLRGDIAGQQAALDEMEALAARMDEVAGGPSYATIDARRTVEEGRAGVAGR